LKWQEKHNAKIISTDDGILLEAYGKEMKLVPGEAMPITMPMEMSNQDQMKSWFLQGSVKKEFLHLYEDIEWVED
jgi:hypothetical protein